MDDYNETLFSYDTGYLTIKIVKEDARFVVTAVGGGWRSTAKFDDLDEAMNEAMRLINDEDGESDE